MWSRYDNHTGSAYQFMSGDWFLVAPVYRNATTRDGIYLPAGDWLDWWDDTVYSGPLTLNSYPVSRAFPILYSGPL
jgi:alpha-glucosidase (family GH31 glycosyl hydrolase)